MCRITLKNCKRLAFTDTCKDCKIHLSYIFRCIDSSCKYYIFYLHIFNKVKTFFCIIFILICRTHNPQFQLWIVIFCITKCHYHSLYIFNRRNSKHCTDIDIFVIRFFHRNIFKPFLVYSVWSNHNFFLRAAKFYLKSSRCTIKRCNPVSLIVCKQRHFLKLVYP